MKALSLRNLARRNRNNPIGLSAGALIVGGAAIAGASYYGVTNARAQTPPSTTLETASDVGLVVGMAATGAGVGSMIHGKMGGMIGAVLLPAAAIGIRALTRATGATLVP